MRPALLLAGGLVGLGAWAYFRQEESPARSGYAENDGGLLQSLNDAAASVSETLGDIVKFNSGWSESKIPPEYLAAIRTAERANGIPHNILARLLYQESRWRPEIVSGAMKSSAGAIGIAQFLPATAKEYGVNPYNAFESIAGAGRYLARLYKSFGNWTEALAAYNWGQGNVRRKGLANAPLETRNYYGQILADVGGGVIV